MARNDKDFLGLEVVNLEDASLVGEVDGLVVDERSASVVAFVVNMGLYEAKLLPFRAIRGLGEDSVMVDSAASLKPVSGSGELEEIAKRNVLGFETIVLNDAGDMVGTVGDYFVDPATGRIRGIEVVVEGENNERSYVIPMSEVIRIGTELVMVKAGFKKRAVSSGETL
jgi:uncharacterized protein YrrD